MRPGSSACQLPDLGVNRKADKSSMVVLSARVTVSQCHSVTGRDTCDTCDTCDTFNERPLKGVVDNLLRIAVVTEQRDPHHAPLLVDLGNPCPQRGLGEQKAATQGTITRHQRHGVLHANRGIIDRFGK